MNHWKTVYRFALVILFVLFAVVLACVFLPKSRELQGLQKTKATLEQENRLTEEQIAELRTKRERFESDPAYVERTARKEGMVRPGETVYKFTPRRDNDAEGAGE